MVTTKKSNKKMKTPTDLQNRGYSGVKVKSMIKALKIKSMYKHLRLVQQNQLCEIENFYERNGSIDKKRFNFVWYLYWNFVLNDFRFEDKESKAEKPARVCKSNSFEHIGMQLLEQLKKFDKD